MKKLFLLIIILIIMILLFLLFNYYKNKNKYELYNNSNDTIIYDNSLVYLYLKDCPRCDKFSDTWKSLINKYNDENTTENNNRPRYLFNIYSYDINDNDKGQQYAKIKGINYAPSILFIIKKDPIEIKEYLNESEMNRNSILEWAFNINKCNIKNN